jgi:hypothetical protein
MAGPYEPEPVEQIRLVTIAEKIRETLSGWKHEIPRGEALCAAVVLVGSEGGYENAHDREKFIAMTTALLGWAFDLGADARTRQRSP